MEQLHPSKEKKYIFLSDFGYGMVNTICLSLLTQLYRGSHCPPARISMALHRSGSSPSPHHHLTTDVAVEITHFILDIWVKFCF